MLPPQDAFLPVLLAALPALQEKDVIVITSKVAAIDQGRAVAIDSVADKEALIESEAQAFIPKASSRYGITLSIKDNTIIASSGVDESNSNGYYTLWPTAPSQWARGVWNAIMEARGIKELGVIITDSHCTPMRWGVTGISIGFFGFVPLTDYRGKPDLFGRPLHYTQGNIADSIAAAAVGVMGEGDERTPVVVVRNWPNITFTDQITNESITIGPDDDIFSPLLTAFQSPVKRTS